MGGGRNIIIIKIHHFYVGLSSPTVVAGAAVRLGLYSQIAAFLQ